jgi:conjugative transfer signal peptidase TraF
MFKSRRGVLPAILAVAAAPGLACAALASSGASPALLWNQTDSEPEGLYVRVDASPAVGRLIAFRAPQRAFPYADARMGYLRHVPILKQVAAVAGDVVCARAGALAINGRWRAPVLDHDRRGQLLPQWNGCRTLLSGEFFVFSDRVQNSFDSRYYGPVTRGEIVGVFQPLANSPAPRGVS